MGAMRVTGPDDQEAALLKMLNREVHEIPTTDKRGWLYNPNQEVHHFQVSETLTPLPTVSEPDPQNADGWYAMSMNLFNGYYNANFRWSRSGTAPSLQLQYE